jgi:hypothetical protein
MEVLYPRCCGLDVHKETVVACLRLVIDGKVVKEVRTFSTTTASLMGLSDWLTRRWRLSPTACTSSPADWPKCLTIPTSPYPQSHIRRYLHTGEHNLLFASWPGDHLLDRAKQRGDADLRRALVRVVKHETARVTVAVPEELAGLDCAFARKKVAPMVWGRRAAGAARHARPLARLPQPKHDRDRAKQGGSSDGLGSGEHVPAQLGRKTFGGRCATRREYECGDDLLRFDGLL